MRLQALFILIFLPLLAACRSTMISGLSSKQLDYYRTVIKHDCFFGGRGSFAASVRSSRFSSVAWEGKWSQGFDFLETQIVDPTGKVLKNNPFTQIESKFGSKGLRRVMCGQVAFMPYLILEDQKIKVKSAIRILSEQNNETVLETKSEFYYGLFSKKSQITLVWKGRIQNGNVTPLALNFGSEKERVSINVLDYE